jgi:predicted unusual protein kinase regulating ubiquinone biosynthesis (AarF/ABC1/UbiB family)
MSEPITSGRRKRMLRMSALTAEVGTSYLWQTLLKPFRSIDASERELLDTHVRNALRIVESSDQLRGAFTKLVQMLSMREDLFPAEALEVLSASQASVPPMPYRMIREQIRAELGKLPEHLFASFEREAFAAASLGQVHRAELRSGETVVVKVQYPGIEQTVDQDLRNIESLLQVLSRFARDVMRQPVDARGVVRELDERLREELDYRHEAASIELFRLLFADDEEIEIPAVVGELSTRRVLTMTRIDGYSLAEVLSPGVDQELKDWVAIKYVRTVCRELLHFGVLHADPHPGNYLVTHHPKLGILDFGSVRSFPEELRAGYLRLARALLADDEAAMIGACRALDFLGPSESGKGMVAILRTVLEPLLVDREYVPREYATLDKAIEVARLVLGERMFRAPGHRVFLLRALLGLESTVKQLGTVANWRRIFAAEVAAARGDRRAPTSVPRPR